MRIVIKAAGKRRKGISIVECIILMVVLGLTIGAIFTTMAWAQKSYAFGKQDKESRELFFSWVQSFESLWRPNHEDSDPKIEDAVEAVAIKMNGTYYGGVSRIGVYTVTATDRTPASEVRKRLVLEITIRTAGRRDPWVRLNRSFNWFSNETVSDDVV